MAKEKNESTVLHNETVNYEKNSTNSTHWLQELLSKVTDESDSQPYIGDNIGSRD